MQEQKVGLIQTFMNESEKGFLLWARKIVPALVFGYVVVCILRFSGLLDLIGFVFTPIMAIFGLPGEAATCIITAYMTLPAGCAAAASMVETGILTARQATVLFPMMYAVASHLLYIGRVLGASGVESKKYPVYYVIGFACCIISGLLMNYLLA